MNPLSLDVPPGLTPLALVVKGVNLSSKRSDSIVDPP